MKKSIAVSSVLIIVLLVVALSTATFAWFSANNTVNVSSITFTADSNEGNGDLAIGWTIDSKDNYRIFFAEPNKLDRIKPMIPVKAPVIGTTTFNDFSSSTNFNTSSQVELDGVAHYLYDGDSATPYVCRAQGEDLVNEFYLINKNTTLSQIISVEYAITGSLASRLCLAVFVDGVFAGIINASSSVYYGAITKDTSVGATPSSTDIRFASGDLQFTISPDSNRRVSLVAWYDGVLMGDADSEQSSTLSSLKFKGEFAGA